VDDAPKIKKVLNSIFDKVLNKINQKKSGIIWSNGRRGNLESMNEINQFDIVHLNWINDSFISVKNISKINKPIVWTLHDLWPLTGGCHIPLNCSRFQLECGNCPSLGRSGPNDLSLENLKIKKESYLNKDITWVAPSHFIKSVVSKHTNTPEEKIVVIHNGIDLTPFKSLNTNKENKIPILLFGALNWHVDKNKGASFLEEALFQLKEEGYEFSLKVFGSPKEALFSSRLNYENLGEVSKEDLPKVFSNADSFLFPSMSETFGLMSIEAQASGTPVVCFEGHGAQETVEHHKTGYVSKYKDREDFILGIRFSIENAKELSNNCKEWVNKNFDREIMITNYKNLYKELHALKS